MFMKSHVLLAFIRLELDDIITFCNKIKKNQPEKCHTYSVVYPKLCVIDLNIELLLSCFIIDLFPNINTVIFPLLSK